MCIIAVASERTNAANCLHLYIECALPEALYFANELHQNRPRARARAMSAHTKRLRLIGVHSFYIYVCTSLIAPGSRVRSHYILRGWLQRNHDDSSLIGAATRASDAKSVAYERSRALVREQIARPVGVHALRE